ncbi:MAG: aspartate kinase [Myxococcota bacterium]|jgi:aspartate kinase|nr:aspartate kinase [Myxococcota bacterium]
MPIIVQKYGGSSVADLDKIREIARKVVACKAAGNDVVVVVSAMGKTTNDLVSLAKQLTDTPPRRELDMLLTTGERITSALLSIAIHAAGYEAVALTGSQCGILTNDRHSDARIIEVRPIRVEDELARGCVVIVAGFQGMSYKREITTLGRGGSDTTAVALAAALGAQRCEIYSDVDGVYTADPAKVLGARHLAELSYEEMQEMAMAGAKVLKAEAVEFAKRAGIAIYARASFAPGRETVVRKDTPLEDHGVRAVVSERDIAWVGLRGTAVTERLVDLLEAAEASLTPIKELRVQNPQGHAAWARGAFAVSTGQLPDWNKAKAALLVCGGQDLEIVEDLAAVSLIGVGINRDARNLTRALRTMQALKAPVLGLSTSGFRISIITTAAALEPALSRLHEAFIENPSMNAVDPSLP